MPRTVYAVEFLPPTGEGGIGGMDMYHCEDDATSRYRHLVEFGDPGSVSLHEIEVDAAATDDAVADLVRDYLDEPERPAVLASTWPNGDEPCVLVEQGNIHRAVWELRVKSLAELVDAVGGAAYDATWRSWNLPGSDGGLVPGLCTTAQISVDDTNRPALTWVDGNSETRRVQGQEVDPQRRRDGHLAVVDALEQIATSLTAALAATTTAVRSADPAPSTSTITAHGVSAHITATREAATTADPDGVVASCTVVGHPGVTVHVHSSTTVDGAVTVLVDAPEGTIIRFDVNDASVAETTVGDDTLRFPDAR